MLDYSVRLIRQYNVPVTQVVIYQDILQKGMQQGKQEEALSFCMSLLEERFGNLDASIVEQIQVLNKEQLEALGRALLRI